MTRARRRMLAASPLVVLAMLATGCHRAATFKAGQNDVNSMPVSRLQDGGTLNWPIATLPVNYNFHQAGANTADELAIVSAVMPSPFTFDASGNPSLNRAYLTSAAVTSESPQQVVTYEINPKATWDDGTPITVADFTAQWQALNGSNRTYRAAAPPGYARIRSVTQGASPRQVVVTFDQPYADWRGLFTPLYPASLNASPDTFNGGWVTGTATSAGPFVYQGTDTVAKTVTLVRDPKWWGQRPKLYSIVFHALGSGVGGQLDALSKGQVDFVGLAPNAAQVQRAHSIGGVVLRRAAGPAFRQLTFNGTSPALSDAILRKAVAMSIDRAAIAKAVLDPLGVAANTLDNHVYMAEQQGYRSNAGDFSTPNPTQAGALLDQVGWKLAGGVRTRNGQPLSIRLVIPDNSAEAPQEANLIKSQLQAVGITVVVQSVSSQQFFDSFVTGGDFDLTLFSWSGALFPISAALPIYASPTVTPSGIDVHQNYARIGSVTIDELFAKASAELDPAKQSQLGSQIDVEIWKEVHSLTLYQLPQLFAQRKTLANFGAFGFASIDYTTIGFAGS